MKVETLIAVRYLFARRQRSVVNIISWISLAGLLVSTMALIVVLSVYNGIGDVTKSLFNTFDPELVIEPSEGRTLHMTEVDMEGLRSTEGVRRVVPVVNESAWITYGQNQAIVRLRGVDTAYAAITGIDTLIDLGTYSLADDDGEGHTLVMGGQIFHELNVHLPSALPAAVHIPKRGSSSLGYSVDQAFNIGYAYPVASFTIQQDIDRQYVITDMAFVQRLMGYAPDECSQLALQLAKGTDTGKAKKRVAAVLAAGGSTGLVVKDRSDQQPLYYKIYRTERLGIYLVLSLIVLISTLSLVASLSLLITTKGSDIFILRSMGMERQRIRQAFLTEGLLISAVAVVAGLALGFVACWLQQRFGIIRMGDGNFVVSAFPVAMHATDFLTTFLLVMAISGTAVVLTVRRARTD